MNKSFSVLFDVDHKSPRLQGRSQPKETGIAAHRPDNRVGRTTHPGCPLPGAFIGPLPLPMLHPSLIVPGLRQRPAIVETQARSLYTHKISAAKCYFHHVHSPRSWCLDGQHKRCIARRLYSLSYPNARTVAIERAESWTVGVVAHLIRGIPLHGTISTVAHRSHAAGADTPSHNFWP